MSRFFVGQRVRLARPTYAENAGLTGTILHFKPKPKGRMMRDGMPLQIDCDCGVLWDDGDRCAAHTSQLEPATDANTVISFDACLWKPDHLRSRVEVGP